MKLTSATNLRIGECKRCGGGLEENLGFPLPETQELKKVGDSYAFLDPRLPEGVLSILSQRNESSRNLGLPEGLRHDEQGDLELMRIRAGLVAIPREIGPNELPQEGGLEENFVDFDKGCYLGQEVMARLHAMGKARRRAVPVYWTEQELPRGTIGSPEWRERSGHIEEHFHGNEAGNWNGNRS